MIRKLLQCAAAVAIVLTAFSSHAPALPADGTVHPEMIVSTQWLSEHLKDPKVVVLEVAAAMGPERASYDAGHIPGARLLLHQDFMEGRDAELPSPQKLKETFEKLGVSDDSRVVVYATDWYPMAARAYYTLDYMGHGDRTALLDGGMVQWKAEKRPLETTEPKVARGSFTPHVHPELLAMMDDVKKISAQDQKSELLVDSRGEKRYTDGGHIAGAVNLYWGETVVDENKKPVLLPPDKLKELFASRGIKPGQKLVTYCEVGLQASHGYFIAKYLGYDAAMYDGSIHQWDMVNHLPLIKGKSLR
jgi:thiosulfate/3-mercaptopyruvate sulfurtransferase